MDGGKHLCGFLVAYMVVTAGCLRFSMIDINIIVLEAESIASTAAPTTPS